MEVAHATYIICQGKDSNRDVLDSGRYLFFDTDNLHYTEGFVMERISYLLQWLRKTNRKPLLAAIEKMKEGT